MTTMQFTTPSSTKSTMPMTPFWLAIWALSLSIGWLLPNHYPPWSSFHVDAWAALISLVAALALLFRTRVPTHWYGVSVVVAATISMPALQYLTGLVTLAGNAWISTSYLFGFFVAILFGARWESSRSGQLADGLFLAVGTAGVLSVGLQLHQWLLLDRLDIWSMGEGYGRPFANFGQANQLGTFLVWGLLALLWGYLRGRVSGIISSLAALYLLFGLSLTGSRTAWLAMSLVLALIWMWHRRWSKPKLPYVVTALAVFLVVCVVANGWLNQAILGGASYSQTDFNRFSGESRPTIWRMFIDAAQLRPWFGYGFNQLAYAQLAVVLDHPPLPSLYSHAHNIFLDLILWFGIPLGLAISVFLIYWFWKRIAGVRNEADALHVLFLVVIFNHAMFELPLHYAHFLLPVGMMIGAVEVRAGLEPVFTTRRRVTAALWFVAALLWVLIVRDYRRVEPAYQGLRMQWAGVKIQKVDPPDVLLLTQWRDFVWLVNFEPVVGMATKDIQKIRDFAGLYPSPGFVQKLAVALALNSQPEEAAQRLRKMCAMVSASQCTSVVEAWRHNASNNPLLAAVPWPK